MTAESYELVSELKIVEMMFRAYLDSEEKGKEMKEHFISCCVDDKSKALVETVHERVLYILNKGRLN